jgi:hypothetical protein
VGVGTLHEVTARHNGCVQTIVAGRWLLGNLTCHPTLARAVSVRTSFASRGVSLATRGIGAWPPDHHTTRRRVPGDGRRDLVPVRPGVVEGHLRHLSTRRSRPTGCHR